MFKTFAALAVVGALALAGCASTTSTTPVASGGLTLSQVEQDATIAAEGICAVAPTAASITSIILASTGNAAGQLSEQAAQAAASAFCSGVVKAKSARRGLTSAGGPVGFGTLVINGRSIPLVGTPVG